MLGHHRWATYAKADSVVYYGQSDNLNMNATGVFETYTFNGAGDIYMYKHMCFC